MPTYSITSPEGKVYSIDGPAGATQEQVIAQIQAAQKAAPAADKSDAAPRWDVLGDIGRAAGNAYQATKDDLSAAFPDATKMDLGPVASVQRMGHALKVPLDAAGVIAAPLTGLVHGVAGSALSYAIPTPGKDADSPLGTHFYSDPKKAADQIIDSSLIGLAPEDPAAFAASAPARAAATEARTAAKTTNRAIDKVNQRAAEDGLTPQQILEAQRAANASGDKVTLMDVGGKNVKGLAGAVYRAPGAAGKEIDTFLDTRDKAATSALSNDIQGNVAKGSTYNATQDLLDARSKAAEPAFKAAMAADSLAPFEHQFRQAVSQATGAKGQIAKQISDIEANNPGALTSRGAAGADVRAKYMDLHQQLEQAEADRQTALKVFQQAKADGSANAPGATWSPRLQQFLDHPEVQSGLKAGLKLEKQDAISEGRSFKDSDYSITGTDEKGDPIVGAVPTMKSLAVAKEGLDAKILEMVDPNTHRPTKAGLSLKKFRNAFVDELDTLNPRYKAARDVWAGPSQSMEAIRDGRQHFSRPESNEQLKAEFDALSPSEKEFYRMGAAEAKVDQVERAPDASDKSKRVINTERDRKRFRILFDNDKQAENFITSVARKRAAFETKMAIKGGSQTAGRIADDANEDASMAIDAAKIVGHAASHNWLGTLHKLYEMKRELGLRNNPALNSEIARILTDHNLPVGDGENVLSRLPVPKRDNYLAAPVVTNALASPSRSNSPPR